VNIPHIMVMATAMMKTTTKPAFLMEVTVVDLMSTHSTVLNVYVMNKDYTTKAHFVEYNKYLSNQ